MSADSTRKVCHKHESLEVSLERIERTTREGFAEVNSTLREVLRDLREGAVQMSAMNARIGVLEKITYSTVALALTGLATALLGLILKGSA